jgi:hypothetical protein
MVARRPQENPADTPWKLTDAPRKNEPLKSP